jgi:transporter family-2 protein
MSYLPHVFAILVGAGLTVQVGMNATVREVLGSAAIATIVNFLVGLVVLVAFAIATGSRVVPGAVTAVPVWAWFGGTLGATYVAAATVLGPRLTAAAFLALTLVGQMVAALIVDHYGAIGFPEQPVTVSRVVGVVLLVVGVLLIMRR